ncbi:CGR1 [[Candida] subhashii]|uniref:rRNA-processing protein n=1 Tax=[Candida] subhashii TaxID=561895 RepID=A0A8J5QLI0_9ASCO|nr:CGR1 [[Candida] subhashii]KAG7665307.1 CGR1 [[Candida] subhashii]
MSSSGNLPYNDIPKKYIDPIPVKDKGEGSRVNGKDWKMKKDAFRVKTLGVTKVTKPSSFKDRQQKKLQEEQYKTRLKELKEEKENTRKQRIEDLKRRREIKAEKERYERMAATMHAKKVERMRKREKRNKLLKER